MTADQVKLKPAVERGRGPKTRLAIRQQIATTANLMVATAPSRKARDRMIAKLAQGRKAGK